MVGCSGYTSTAVLQQFNIQISSPGKCWECVPYRKHSELLAASWEWVVLLASALCSAPSLTLGSGSLIKIVFLSIPCLPSWWGTREARGHVESSKSCFVCLQFISHGKMHCCLSLNQENLFFFFNWLNLNFNILRIIKAFLLLSHVSITVNLPSNHYGIIVLCGNQHHTTQKKPLYF